MSLSSPGTPATLPAVSAEEECHKIVYAADLPACDCCDEPWCPVHQMHYAECACIGPHNAEELGYRLEERSDGLYAVKP